MTSNVSFIHANFENRHGFKRGTVAYKVQDGKLMWGISLCNDTDNYSRKEGRTRALIALEERSNCVDFSTVISLSILRVQQLMMSTGVGIPLTLPGISSIVEHITEKLESSAHPEKLVSSEFLERIIKHTFQHATPRSQWTGNLVFNLSHFE